MRILIQNIQMNQNSSTQINILHNYNIPYNQHMSTIKRHPLTKKRRKSYIKVTSIQYIQMHHNPGTKINILNNISNNQQSKTHLD